MTLITTPSFWNNNHPSQSLRDAVAKLVPSSGSVENPRKNRALEKFRKASNCYYDLFNNGLCNRSVEFRTVFDLNKSELMHKFRGGWDFKQDSHPIWAILESKMNEIVLCAAQEQSVDLCAN